VLLGIDHIVLACTDPDTAAERIRREMGLAPGGGGRHERFGTFNRLVWLGDSYVELMGVFDPALARGRSIGAKTLALLEMGRQGVASFAVATDDIRADVAVVHELAAFDEPASGERLRPDGEVVRWQTALPTDPGGDGLPFLIEHELSGPEWGEAPRRARAEFIHPFGGRARLIRLELAVSDPGGLADRYQAALRVPSLRHSGDRADLPIGGQVVRLVREGAGVPPATIVIGVTAGRPRSVDLLGCRFEVEVEAEAEVGSIA
jgi:hypothetical protein